jgi:tRNA A-37 threonylcarbamoyl transferase component Bud32
MALDLSIYGMNFSLDTNATDITTAIPANPQLAVYKVIPRSNEFTLTLANGDIKKFRMNGASVGQGSFGKTYPIIDLQDNTEKVIKITDTSDSKIVIIKEAILQLIIMQETESLTNGPFCPELFYVGESQDLFCLIMEKMDKKTMSEIIDTTGPLPDTYYYNIILQLSTMLKILFDKLRFNHRDLKCNNIMFKNGVPKLIDFGFSCLKYNNLTIAIDSSGLIEHCNKTSRDIASLFFNLQYYYLNNRTNFRLYRLLRILLSYYDNTFPQEWGNTYKIFNSSGNKINMELDVIINIFSNPSDGDTWTRHLKDIHVDIFTLLNPEEYKNINKKILVSFLTGHIDNLKHSKFFYLDLEYMENENTAESDALLNFLIQHYNNTFKLRNSSYANLFSVIISENAFGFFKKFITDPRLNLIREYNEILHNIVKNKGTDDYLTAILSVNSSPEFINIKDFSKEPALFYAIQASNHNAMKILVDIPGINLRFNNSTALSDVLLKLLPDANTEEIIDKILEKDSSVEFLSLFHNLAIRNAFKNTNEYGVTKLISLGIQVPLDILMSINDRTTPRCIDLILKYANEPQFLNYVNSSGFSVLMNSTEIPNINTYFFKKLLEFPQLKTAYRHPRTGKTALHYLAEISNRVSNYDHGTYMTLTGRRTMFGPGPYIAEMMKQLIKRNPALVDIKDNEGKGPGNPAYVNRAGYTRSLIKGSKRWFGTHKNTNLQETTVQGTPTQGTTVQGTTRKTTSAQVTPVQTTTRQGGRRKKVKRTRKLRSRKP